MYASKLHAEVPRLQQAGVRVEYIPFARAGAESEGAAEMRAVWCAEDRAAAMDIAKGVREGELGPGDCPVAGLIEIGSRLAKEVGVTGTPAIVPADGTLLPGYRPAARLLQALGLAVE